MKTINIDKLKQIASDNIDLLFSADENGWQPIHEAAAGGHPEVIKMLIEYGADINAKTNDGDTPLYWATTDFGDEHPAVSMLMENGGV